MATGLREAASAKQELAAALQGARERTLRLVEPITDEQLVAQVSPIMSPLVWDLAHIGWFEELWLVRRIAGGEPSLGGFDELYDAFEHPRAERSKLPILAPSEARTYLADVRARALRALEAVHFDELDPLLRDGYVYRLVVQHELQHQETMQQTLQLAGLLYETPPHDELRAAPRPEDVLVPSGPFTLGTNEEPWAYDNEQPAHVVDLPPFRIERHPVTNERFTEFLEQERIEAPLYWRRARGGWDRQRLGRWEPVAPAEPVQHISFYQAEAVAAWAGKRLPTEPEWEKAAKGGALARVGSVWEWTSSTFTGYPGFTAFPYDEYSRVFFGGNYRVLRGGSWATDPLVARVTFRNWDYPQRRQLFSGVRLASDA